MIHIREKKEAELHELRALLGEENNIAMLKKYIITGIKQGLTLPVMVAAAEEFAAAKVASIYDKINEA